MTFLVWRLVRYGILKLTHYHFVCSTRISNELGAGNPKAVRISICVVFALATVEFLLASAIIFFLRKVWGYAFTNEQEVVNLTEELTPILCLSIILDSIITLLAGVARGSGWQHIVAYVNLGAYYLIGIPASLLMGFVLNWKEKGLWSGLIMGSIAQAILLSVVTYLTNWAKQKEIGYFDGKVPPDSTDMRTNEIIHANNRSFGSDTNMYV
uniref:MATE efflux family protein 7-like n=1 Tax=Nicotiana sylvestris TaxID=4096 RepID=A0A1U7W9V4_NICSY|nr:PREDICTED: MATE efflux family protein 7-like [Nicotiana sylvestris]